MKLLYRKTISVGVGLFLMSQMLYAQRIIGYFPSSRASEINTFQYSKLTDVVYCYLNPNANGTLNLVNSDATFGWDNATFIALKAKCKPALATGPRLIVCVGGPDAVGARAQRLYDVSSNTTYRSTFVSGLVSFAMTHNLHSLLIDWEFPTTTAAKNAHESLLADLRVAINASANPALQLGIAVGPEYAGGANHLTYANPTAIQYVDDVHVMAYNFSAAYNADHSTRTDANASLMAWYNWGIPKSKLILGIPLFGWSNPRGATPIDYDLNPNYQTAYNSGFDGAYYFNSKATVENKVSDIMAFGGQGVFLSDLGQDRTDPWSYLSVIKARMDVVCTAPQPDLGADVNLCLPGNVILDSKQPALLGRTFVWKRNGSVLMGQSSPTCTVSTGGFYAVEITQAACTKTDEVFVNEGSPLTLTGASRCGAGQVTLSAVGGSYQWYDAPTGGNLLATASSYSPTISTTTTYFVQPNVGSVMYNGGKATINSATANNSSGFDPSTSLPRYAHKVTILQNTTLVSASVYYGSGVNISGAKIMIISATNGTSVVDQTSPLSLPIGGSPYSFNVNKSIPPGTYYIGVYAPVAGGANPGIWLEPSLSYPSSQAGVFEIEGKCYINTGSGFNAPQTPTDYGQLFGLVFSSSVQPACGRTPVVATVTSGATQNLLITSNTPVCSGSSALITISNSQNNVSYQAHIGGLAVGTPSIGNGTNLLLSIPSASLALGNNTITITATLSGCGTVNMDTQPVITVSSLPNIPGAFTTFSSTVSQSSSNVGYTVPLVAGVTYTWMYSGLNTVINGTSNAVLVNFGATATSGNLSVVATNSCGTSASRTIAVTVSPSNTIITSLITNSSCQSQSMSINYTVTGSFDPGNVFTAQLSNASGSFANPVNIGTLTATGSGSITATIPYSTTPGTAYRVRVVSSNPATVGSDNGQDITITKGSDPNLSINGPSYLCNGASSQTYSIANPVVGSTYTWTVPSGVTIVSGQNTSNLVVNFGNSVTGNISVQENKLQTCPGPVVTKAVTSYSNFALTASAITGPAHVCVLQNNVVYTVDQHNGSTYAWTVPTGFNIVSGQGTNSISVNIMTIALAGNVSVTETNVCNKSTSVFLPVNVKSYYLTNTPVFCGGPSTFNMAFRSAKPISSGLIGVDFRLNYDATKMTPTGIATLGDVATAYGAYALNTTTPGIIYVSVYLNNAPVGTFFNGAGDLIYIEFSRQAGFAINTTSSLSTQTIEESSPIGSVAVCNAVSATVSYTGSYNASLVYRNTADLIKGAATKAKGTTTNCTVQPAYTSAGDANGILRFNVSGSTTGLQVSRDIVGDKDIPMLQCSNVQSAINAMDRNLALSISNYTLSNPSVYQLIAADVNLDGKVTAGDASLISSRSVNAYHCEFPQASNYVWDGTDFVPHATTYAPSLDWLFIDQATISNPAFTAGMGRNNVPQVPKCIPLAAINPAVCNNGTNGTFQGILLGDVDGNWTNANDGASMRRTSADALIIDLEEASAGDEGTYLIPVKYEATAALQGLDFSMDYLGSAIAVDQVQQVSINDWSSVYHDMEEEQLMVSAHSSQGIRSSAAVLNLKVTSHGVPTKEDLGKMTAYINGLPALVRIKDGSGTTSLNNPSSAGVVLAYPNPFTQSMVVKMPEDQGSYRVNVYDISGRICESKELAAGGEELELGSSLRQGVYVIEVEGAQWKNRLKVIKQ